MARIDIASAEAIEGWMHPTELEWLARAAANSAIVIEIGSWKGRSTKALASHTSGYVYAVDDWEGRGGRLTAGETARRGSDTLYREFIRNLGDELSAGKLIPVRSESGEAARIIAQALNGRGADLVFIDGQHTYDAVCRDIDNYAPLVRPGGTVSGHDYCEGWPGVIKAVSERFPSGVSLCRNIWHVRMP